ncbi:MAG: hypothetical protein ACJAVT_002746 [Yoonia sp.]|jgi:hypothetical protein
MDGLKTWLETGKSANLGNPEMWEEAYSWKVNQPNMAF